MISERAQAMRARVLEEYRRLAGVAAEARFATCLTGALALRSTLDPQHPWALHPARTALILLADCAELDADVLSAAVAIDSLVPEWHAQASVGAPGGLVAQVPVPASAGEELLEALVAAPRRARLIACAERLDHARHLHLVEIPAAAAFRAEIAAVYAPVAERTDAVLARRMHRWLEARRRRH